MVAVLYFICDIRETCARKCKLEFDRLVAHDDALRQTDRE